MLSGADIALVAGAASLSALVQTVSGFGGALVASPVFFAVLTPSQAVTIMALLGLFQSGTVAVLSRAHIRREGLVQIGAGALPGLLAGAFVLRVASSAALQLGVAAAVLVALALRRSPQKQLPPALPAALGLLVGTLTTSITINGPPLVLWLRARGASPDEQRGTLAALFVFLDIASLPALALASVLSLPGLTISLAIGACASLGLILGRLLAPRVQGVLFDRLVVTILLFAVVQSVRSALF